ncbi:twin-arginine translocation signal domain-containing protein [Luminiphilus sp. nBUS_16]|uniref:twin-arginine translocation signal domain-containing protein n=1 Tax=Luminiphilus sp. nBUS_16 TaxID=3395315 RepID=UPI003EB87947
MSDKNKKESKTESRRQFVTGAAAGTLAAAALMSSNASALQGVKRAPFGTKVHEMLDSDSAKKLTADARKLSKGQLLEIRQYHRHSVGSAPKVSINDIKSIEDAFDSHALRDAASQGFKVAGVTAGMGISAAAAGNVTACCCCCPCCSTAAAVTSPDATK